jgi:3-deoxy-manno-octulosonate cytidylyltransferase (CMP-KDO synthetase)
VPKVVTRDDGTLVYMSRCPVPFVKNPEAMVVYRRQVCIYAFTPAELRVFAGNGGQSPLEQPEDIEILRFLDLGIGVQMVEVGGSSVAVDVPGDVARVEAILSAA